jgi:type I restriction enzyme R subunit
MNKRDLSERDICSKFIGPAVKRAGWDGMMQIREEVAFTKGRIIVRGKLVTHGKAKRADYILILQADSRYPRNLRASPRLAGNRFKIGV